VRSLPWVGPGSLCAVRAYSAEISHQKQKNVPHPVSGGELEWFEVDRCFGEVRLAADQIPGPGVMLGDKIPIPIGLFSSPHCGPFAAASSHTILCDRPCVDLSLSTSQRTFFSRQLSYKPSGVDQKVVIPHCPQSLLCLPSLPCPCVASVLRWSSRLSSSSFLCALWPPCSLSPSHFLSCQRRLVRTYVLRIEFTSDGVVP